MTQASVINLNHALTELARSSKNNPEYAFAQLSSFGNGAAFITQFSGTSPWERHVNGDEFVYVVDGNTNMTIFTDGHVQNSRLSSGDIMIVPRGVWHRFETSGMKLLSLTPLPTDVAHSDQPPR